MAGQSVSSAAQKPERAGAPHNPPPSPPLNPLPTPLPPPSQVVTCSRVLCALLNDAVPQVTALSTPSPCLPLRPSPSWLLPLALSPTLAPSPALWAHPHPNMPQVVAQRQLELSSMGASSVAHVLSSMLTFVAFCFSTSSEFHSASVTSSSFATRVSLPKPLPP